MIPNGTYRTDRGSTVTVSGKHGGIAEVVFDWFEELDACCDCKPQPMPVEDDGLLYLYWDCEYCQGGRAPLKSVAVPGS